MKKLALVLAVCIILISATPLFVFSADESHSVSIKDGDILSGLNQILFSSSDEGAISAKLDGAAISGTTADEFALIYSASGVDYTNNGFYIGDELLCNIKKSVDEEKKPLSSDMLDGDTLEITLLPSTGSSVLDTTKEYGTYNADDMVITSIYLLLPMGKRLYPATIIKGMPIQGKAGVTSVEETYNKQSVSVGDGWNQSTGMGGTTPNVPIKVTFRFDLSQIDVSAQNAMLYELDTATLADGTHTLDFFVGAVNVKQVAFIVDNTPPEFGSNLTFGQTVTRSFIPSITAEDANGVEKLTIFLNGKEYKNTPLTNLENGKHIITAIATDTCGNTASVAYQFNVASDFVPLLNPNAVEITNKGRIKVAIKDNIPPATAELYTYTPVNEINAMITDGAGYKPYVMGETTSTKASENPVHYFDIAVPETDGALKIEYTGEAYENAAINIYARNISADGWDIVGIAYSGNKTIVTLPEITQYVKDGIVRVMAEPAIKVSASDSLMWLSDTQYYSRFENLYPTYKSVMNYAVELYGRNEIGYFIHTGDVVDEYTPTEIAIKQYEAASSIQKIIDDAGLPNGIVSGNHDVDMSNANHNLFGKYFGSERYSSNMWYGGDLNNNTNHYDLISIGGYDFIFMYLGWGVENSAETVAWASAVLNNYKNRNAIICLHGYLGTDGKWYRDPANPLSYTHTRGTEVWEDIVVPNENVVAVFCGHVHGAARNKRMVEGTDRFVWEILANYQFAELDIEPKNVLNGMTCDGEGFIRLVQFTEDGKMVQRTYSSLHDIHNFFSADADSFTVELQLRQSEHTLTTSSITAICGYRQLDAGVTNVDNKYITFDIDKNLTDGKIILLIQDENGNKYETDVQAFGSNTVQIIIIIGIVAVIALLAFMYIGKKSEK